MPQQDYAIRVRNVSKVFRVHSGRNNSLKEKLIYAGRTNYRDFTALKDVSVDIPKGSTVALLGMNGSGKSTLLKIISRILYPNSGTVEVNGRVSSLLELGAGFHPDFTGVENIYLNGSLVGLSRREIRNKLDEIIEFSELGDFIQEPIRNYSSGMYMRLAFSVAIAVDPDILLVDEILAVGDAPFQAKCMSRIKQLQAQHKTIVMVTHDTNAVQELCDHAVWLHDSRVRLQGEAGDCVRQYLQTVFNDSRDGTSVMTFDRVNKGASEQTETSEVNPKTEPFLVGIPELVIEQVSVTSGLGAGVVDGNQPVSIAVRTKALQSVRNIIFHISIYSHDGTFIYGTSSTPDHVKNVRMDIGTTHTVTFHVTNCSLAAGTYTVVASASSDSDEYTGQPASLRVTSDSRENGFIRLEHNWEFS